MGDHSTTKYSLVQFLDGKKKTKYLTLSNTIKGFNPKSPDDITDQEYQVKWQGSFHDADAGIDDDGCYPAKILLVGATPNEIRAKAKELKMALPMSFPPVDDKEKKSPLKKPLRKPRKRHGDEDATKVAVKSRMMETNSLLSESLSDKNKSDSSKRSRSKMQLHSGKEFASGKGSAHGDQASSSQKYLSDKGERFKRTNTESLSDMNKSDSPKRSQSKLQLEDESDFASGKGSAHGVMDSSSRNYSSDKGERFKRPNTESLSDMNKSDSPKRYRSKLQLEDEKDFASGKGSAHGVMDSSSRNYSSDKGERFKRPNTESLSDKNKSDSPKKSQSQSKLQLEREKYFASGKWSAHGDKHIVLTGDQSSSSSAFETVSGSDDDDATVEGLQEKNQNLKKQPKALKQKLSDVQESCNDLMVEVNNLKAENTDMRKQLQPSGGVGLSRSPSLKGSSPSSLAQWSPLVTSGGKADSTGETPSRSLKSIRKNLFDLADEENTPEKNTDMTPKKIADKGGLEGVAERIKDDLSGKKPLSGDEKRVDVGMGLKIGRKAWEENLRLKKEDSKFLKDCASHIWGTDALMVRTGNRKTNDKKPCTPKKVALLHAMLKGKMVARGESKKQQEFILQNMAPRWLTDKCYDCGRPPKVKKD